MIVCTFRGIIITKHVRNIAPHKSILLDYATKNDIIHHQYLECIRSFNTGLTFFENDYIRPDPYALENVMLNDTPFSYMKHQTSNAIMNSLCPRNCEIINSGLYGYEYGRMLSGLCESNDSPIDKHIGSDSCVEKNIHIDDSLENVPESRSLDNSLLVRCLNVAGLHSKLNRGILDYYMSKADVIVLLETNTDNPVFENTMLLRVNQPAPVATKNMEEFTEYVFFLMINLRLTSVV